MAAFLKTFRLQRLLHASFNNLKLQESGSVFISRRNFKAKWVAPTLRDLKHRKDIENTKNGGPKIFHRSTFLEW